MRVVEAQRSGGPEVLVAAERPDPEPGAGELVVEVAAAGVNYIDTYQRSGTYPTDTPFVPGLEAAGTVRAVGDGVGDVAVGDPVGWSGAMGSYAELAVVPADVAVPLPDGLDPELAAAVLLQGMTAHYLAVDVHPVAEGEWVLVHAAAGGVGLLLTQICRLRGGHVLATCSTQEKAELARAAGAEEVVVGYDGFPDAARRVGDGRGVHAVYDGVGRATFDGSLASLRPRGMLALFGAASGQVPPLDPQRLAQGGSLFLTRPSLMAYTATRDELLRRAGDVLGWVADGRLDVRIGARYPLAEARRAHEDLEGRRTTGKLLLHP